MAVFDKFTGIGVASGFKLQAKAPLDGRLVVDTTADRDALVTENGAYEGMVVYVKADQTLYKLDGTTNEDWSAIGGDVAADLGELSTRVTTAEGDIDTIEESLSQKISTTEKGASGGVAELDETGKVPSSQLPSYVDDVVEGYYYTSKFYKEAAHTTEITGETGKIYVDLSTNKTYRWSGTAYAEISASLALGETSSSAYRGDRGKIAYDHSQTAHAPADAEKNVIAGVQVNGEDLTADGSRKVNIEVPEYSEATTSAAGLMSAADKTKVDAMPTITVSATAPSTAAPNSLWFQIEE